MIEHYFAKHTIGMIKLAARASEEKPKSIPRVVGEGLLGLGAGTLAGYGIGRGIEAAARPMGVPMSRLIPRVGAVGGALVGTGYPLWKAYESAAIQQALADRRAQLARKAR